VTQVEPPVSVLVQHSALEDVLPQCAGRRVWLYAPSFDIRLMTATVPVKTAAKALAAVPYAVEEQFAEDVESLHFAIANQALSANEWAVAAVSHSHMRSWLAPFSQAGITPDALLPETLALPYPRDGRWTVLAEAGQVMVRTGHYSGFGCLDEDFEQFLNMAEGGTPQALRILIAQGVATDFTKLNRDIELLPGLDHPLQAFARNAQPAQAINLLQGPYLVRQGYQREWLAWRKVAALASVALLLAAIGNGVAALQMSREADRQRTANEARFRALFPTEQRIVDLAAQTEQQFRTVSGGGQPGMVPLMEALAGGLKAAPSLTLQSLQFREGALFASLTGTDLAALDLLRNHYGAGASAGLEVQSANAADGGVQIRIKLSPP
jgi:general secretion pathway protein L